MAEQSIWVAQGFDPNPELLWSQRQGLPKNPRSWNPSKPQTLQCTQCFLEAYHKRTRRWDSKLSWQLYGLWNVSTEQWERHQIGGVLESTSVFDHERSMACTWDSWEGRRVKRWWWWPHGVTTAPWMDISRLIPGCPWKWHLCFSCGLGLMAVLLCRMSPLYLPAGSCHLTHLLAKGLSPSPLWLEQKASALGRKLPWKQKTGLSLKTILSLSFNYLLFQ